MAIYRCTVLQNGTFYVYYFLVKLNVLLKRHLLFGLLTLLLTVNTGGVYAQQTRVQKVSALYDSLLVYEIEYPQTVLAQAMFETGWMECKKCTYRWNNLFGFRGNGNYMRFASISDCLVYLKKWQVKYYQPWRKKHPKATYYEFLTHLKYAADMPTYLNKIKQVERRIKKNVPETQPS